MPENPGKYKAIPPVTIISNVAGVRVAATNVGTIPQIQSTPAAMSDPKQVARIFDELQTQVARSVSQQTSDPHTGRVIFQDESLVGGTPLAIPHGLGRKFRGWSWNRPRVAAPTIFEVVNTTAQPADKFLIIQSGVTCTVDVEIW